ncbi:hypothetical protein [Lutibacter maritimus]|uniref:PKD domain-containing protein n=1 Tax=Lutibacter maritimus TaxID=593133 RepID=A0A1I6Q8Y2_9FLAO|nr:hypothetical protein [Lutibacter maritimus]SFS48828.1 hypothetical protein SAMN04488006_1625 [Lutibacter maritimus]
MKVFKYILNAILLIAVLWSCSNDEMNNLDFTKSAVAPTNVEALFTITQDNTGLVSIAPSAEGAVAYDINFGDTSASATIKAGKKASHVYAEGSYTVGIAAKGITGLTTEYAKEIVVSFQAPEFGTDPIIANDAAKSKQVNVTVPNDTKFAMFYDAYFVENGVETVLTANVGDKVSYTYANPGTYTIKVVLKGGAIATTEYVVTDFEVTEILQPIKSAPAQPGRQATDYISIFSDSYTNVAGSDFNPYWWQNTIYTAFSLNGDAMLQYSNLNYQGIQIGAAQNVSGMETLHIDVWSATANTIEFYPLPVGIAAENEKFFALTLLADQWNSFDIPLSYFSDLGLALDNIHQFKFVGAGSIFVDNIYFYKAPSAPSVLSGTWKLAPEANAFKVGPTYGSGDWWGNSAGDVTARACLFDDKYVFANDGSFKNVMDGSTWVEAWQGVSEGCGTPVAPHNGSAAASFYYDEVSGKLTVTGKGAYLGISKPYNGGELASPSNAPDSITYDVVLSDNDNTMTLSLYYGAGFWTFKLVRDVPPVVGNWKLAPEAYAFMVGDSYGSGNWWGNSADDVTGRACLFDDEYIFSANGSFKNELGGSTWIETWQGTEGCGTPVAPHDGSTLATYSYDATAGTVTVIGTGAYLGIPKPYNGGELSDPANAPGSITYDATFSDGGNTMTLVLYYGAGYWTFKLVK